LPAHILQEAFQAVEQDAAAAESFSNLPFWSVGYVGAGPYRLERFEPGAYFEGVAFASYALGRPKIDRVILRAVGDGNRVLTDLLAGELDWAPRLSLRFEHEAILKQDWVPSGRGSYETGPTFFIMVQHQFRPEFETERALYDVRVRRAIAHAVDKQALLDGLFGGESEIPDTFALRSAPYFAAADRVITKYPYDPRRTQQLMLEAGLTRDQEGFFAYGSGQRLRPDFLVRAGSELERAQAIMVDTWKRAGLDVQTTVQPDIALPLIERSNFPNLQAQTHTFDKFNYWATSDIGTAANGWRGDNRAGWSNPEMDQLFDRLRRTLDRPELDRITVQIVKLLSEEVPGYPVYVPPALSARVATLRGPTFGAVGSPATSFAWNIHEWEYAN
jgi:peptide/nickel transport system substrate-binding protein